MMQDRIPLDCPMCSRRLIGRAPCACGDEAGANQLLPLELVVPPALADDRGGVRSGQLSNSVARPEPWVDIPSASTTITRSQQRVLAGLAAALVIGVVIAPIPVLTAVIAFLILVYLAVFVYRIKLTRHAIEGADMVRVSDEVARTIPDHLLPPYTVMIPAYHEPEVIEQLIESMNALVYPRDRLEVKLLLEEDDTATIEAALAARPAPFIQIVRVPYSLPRTKPKALNYGLAHATGRYVTIFDAEDRPDPLQLRRAVVAFHNINDTVACLQAKLVYHNPEQNLITRWFTTEYALWFSQMLPGLVRENAPVPLGGTSNHFRREVLEQAGGWDAFNVTEDADLGIRLHRLGYRTGVLDSVTYEEANSDFINWVKQRSRWYKGYMQTWLVHMRQPAELWRALGPRAFAGFNLFVAGTPLLALINPVFWVLTLLWFTGQPRVVQELFPAWLYYFSLFTWAVGNFTFVYLNMISARFDTNPKLVLSAILSPLYWVMMSIAAVKALWQLVVAPSFWEKTVHGLSGSSTGPATRPAASEGIP
jgi:cellulose synthase/poly-beta-1,6-N-acetylglucosamine synthase-like glycosyltransferase